jgi:hypothetical protein
LRDRIVIARLRKLVLELGQALAPEQLEAKLGPLKLWITAPTEELDGRSPMADFDEPGGEERLLVYLSKVLGNRLKTNTVSDRPNLRASSGETDVVGA